MDRAEITAAREPLALAQFLRHREAEILEEWERAMREVPPISELTRRTLAEHMPELLSRLAEIAERLPRADAREAIDESAARHVIERLENGLEENFDLGEIIAELALLRDAIARILGAEPERGPTLDMLRLSSAVIDGAIAASIARFTTERDRTLRALDRISAAALESKDLQGLLEKLLGVLLETTTTVDTAVILLREGDYLVTRAAVGLEGEEPRRLRVKIGEGFAGTIAEEQRPRSSRSAATDPLVQSEIIRAKGVRALYGIPLADGEVIGVACLGSLTVHDFSEQEKRLFAAMSHRATAGILQHMLRASAERRAEQQQAIAELGVRALVEDDLEATLEEAVLRVSRVLDADYVAIRASSHEGGLIPRAVCGEPPGSDEAAEELRAFIRAPGQLGELFGVMEAARDERFAGPEDAHFLQAIANVVAAAMARKHDEARRVEAEHERERLLEAETKARAEAEQAIETRDQFLGTVSHDLKNPLGAVMMSSALLLKASAFDERAVFIQKNAEIIQRAAQRMNRLLHDLVDLASIHAKRLSIARAIHDPRELAEETLETFQSIADERGLVLSSRIARDLPRVSADRDRILQVLSNLVGNAVKATESGGVIAIHAERRGSDVLFSVSDTGKGISPEDLPLIFDRYWRGKAAGYKGTGLGLAIARGIVDAHGGRIWAESTPGRGSRFFFTVPVAEPRAVDDA